MDQCLQTERNKSKRLNFNCKKNVDCFQVGYGTLDSNWKTFGGKSSEIFVSFRIPRRSSTSANKIAITLGTRATTKKKPTNKQSAIARKICLNAPALFFQSCLFCSVPRLHQISHHTLNQSSKLIVCAGQIVGVDQTFLLLRKSVENIARNFIQNACIVDLTLFVLTKTFHQLALMFRNSLLSQVSVEELLARKRICSNMLGEHKSLATHENGNLLQSQEFLLLLLYTSLFFSTTANLISQLEPEKN